MPKNRTSKEKLLSAKTELALQIIHMSEGRSLQIDSQEWDVVVSETDGTSTLEVLERDHEAIVRLTSPLGDEGLLLEAYDEDEHEAVDRQLFDAIRKVAAHAPDLAKKVIQALPPTRI